jgi:hypothetical protein
LRTQNKENLKMAIWKVSNRLPRSVAEREIWKHSDKGEIIRETLFTHGAYLVETEDGNPPEFERETFPGGDGAENSVDMNFCGYETKLIDLEGGVKLKITWPGDMSDVERQTLLDSWDEDFYDGWESKGWDLNDNEVWFWGELNVEYVESGGDENHEENTVINQGWLSSDIPPSSPGEYAIETVEKAVWPFPPITEANWNGNKWLDDDGELINVKQWKELNR